MTTITNTHRVMIHAPLETVFAYVTDLTRHPEWSGGRLKVKADSSGPVAVGSRYYSHGDLPGQKDRPNELRVTHLQPHSLFTFIANDPGFGDVVHTFTFKPEGDGTLVERAVTTTLPPLMAVAHRIFIHPLIGKPMMDKAMTALKAKLEKQKA